MSILENRDIDLMPIRQLLDDSNDYGDLLRAALRDLLFEVERLRQDRDHGRAWAEQWRFNAIGDLTSEPTEEPIAAASDGWAVAAPTEEEVNAYFRGGCCDGR